MPRRKLNTRGAVSSANTDDAFVADVRGIEYVSISCKARDAAWPGSLVMTVEVTQDCVDWYTAQYVDAATGTATNVSTFTANGIKRLVPCFDSRCLRVRVSTTNGSATIDVHIYGEGEEYPSDTLATSGELGLSIAVGGYPTGGGSGSGGGSSTSPAPGGGALFS